MNLAIIPARAGSKRIPNKNIKLFNGKPILSYAIETAINSNIFDKIIVSTDSDEIAKVALEYGAEVPFLRSKSLADDFSGIHEVISDSISQLLSIGYKYKYACCIYATAPFINTDDLISGYKKISAGSKKVVIGATNYSYPVQRSFFINNSNEIEMLFPEKYNSRSQDLFEVMHDAGQFSWASCDTWMKDPIPFGKHHDIVLLPSWRVQDIDTIEDWERAELIAKLIQAG
tara:strand:- start:1382 stop:2071 length:690 start_codon:yes stop_codon:yes gene_type:complete